VKGGEKKPELRVICISSNWPGQRHSFGDVFFKRCLAGLSENGHRIVVLAPLVRFRDSRVDGEGRCIIKQPNYFSFSNIQIPLLGNTVHWGNYFKASACLRQSKVIVSEGFTPEIVYAKFFSSALTAKKVARYHGIPWVVSVGESVLDYEENLIPTHGKSVIQQVLQDADGIEAVSHELSEYLVRRFEVCESRVHMIPNGVDTNIFHGSAREKVRKRLGLDVGKFIICFVGADNHNKGARRVLRAAQRLRCKGMDDIGLLLLGNTKNLNSMEGVEYAGRAKPEEMPLYMAASDIFVLPTTNEGMSNSILEAMSVGLPVVSSDLSFNREILCEDNGVLVDPLDVEAIAKAIKRLKINQNLRRQLGLAARRTAESMDIRIRVKKIEKMLVDVIR